MERQNTFKSLAEDLSKFGDRPIAMEVFFDRVDFICKELDSTVSISYNPRWSAEYTIKAEDIKDGDN